MRPKATIDETNRRGDLLVFVQDLCLEPIGVKVAWTRNTWHGKCRQINSANVDIIGIADRPSAQDFLNDQYHRPIDSVPRIWPNCSSKMGIHYSLLADFNPRGAMAEKYGAFLCRQRHHQSFHRDYQQAGENCLD